MNKRRKTEENSDWKDGFLFVGNHLILDFLNTRPVPAGEAVELLPDFGALLRWFRAADLLDARDAANLQRQWGDTPRARQTLQAMRELREKLRKETRAWEKGAGIGRAAAEELNRLMAAYPMLSRLKVAGNVLSTELWFEARKPEDLFAPVAYSAAMMFASVNHERVRKCEHCVLHFHDTSKKGTRRWCSMRLCGNRLKVAAYAARKRLRARDRVTPA